MKKFPSFFWAVCLLIGIAACSSDKVIDTVTVEGGKLQGVLTENPDIIIFKGVPYAAPPVGELRWAYPNGDGVDGPWKASTAAAPYTEQLN